MTKYRRICVTGPPGVGKTTIAQALKDRGVCSIDIDTSGLCSWRDRNTNARVIRESPADMAFIKDHEWICDIVRLEEIMEGVDEAVVVCGVVSNQEKYVALFDKVLLLQCSSEMLVSRLEARDGFGKDAIIQGGILEWLEGFERDMLARGAIPIDAGRDPKYVADAIMSHL